MNDNINPKHYRNGDIECIEAIRAALTPEEFRGYCKGNAIKYVWREGMKGGNESLQKANWYMDKAVSVSTQPQPAKPARAEELQADDGWIEWRGGECPVSKGTRVDIRYSSGIVKSARAASNYNWRHEYIDSNVVAYRVTKDQS